MARLLVAAPDPGARAGMPASSGTRATAAHQQWPDHWHDLHHQSHGHLHPDHQDGHHQHPRRQHASTCGALAREDDPFQHPSPVLCVNEGDTVTIVLHNTLPEDVSIIFPGQENVLANGEPSQPQFDGGGDLTSLAPVAAANGGSMTYSFVASKPGTYLYESGTDPTVKQVNMGLFGALGRPAGSSSRLGLQRDRRQPAR